MNITSSDSSKAGIGQIVKVELTDLEHQVFLHVHEDYQVDLQTILQIPGDMHKMLAIAEQFAKGRYALGDKSMPSSFAEDYQSAMLTWYFSHADYPGAAAERKQAVRDALKDLDAEQAELLAED